MPPPLSRPFAAMASSLIAMLSVVVLVWLLAGTAHFQSTLTSSLWHVLVISAVAGVLRLFFRSEGLGVSVVCGLLVAIAGFAAVLWYAVGQI